MKAVRAVKQREDVVGVLLPAIERFDGTGGAVATWVAETYRRLAQPSVVFSPRSSKAFAGGVKTGASGTYAAFDFVLRACARAISRAARRPFINVLGRLLGDDRVWVRYVARRARRSGIDLLHVHNRPGYVGLLRRYGYRGAIILHMHNSPFDYVTGDELGQIAQEVSTIIFCSEYLRRITRQRIGDVVPTVVVRNGVDSAQAMGASAQDRPAGSMAFVGRIVPEKGALEAVEVCGHLRSQGVPASLVLVGGTTSGTYTAETEYLHEVREAVRKVNAAAGEDVVREVGPVRHERVMSILRGTEFLVHPCLWEEPFGMVVIEGMACGAVPVVTSRGGLREVVGDAGIVVAAENHRVATAVADQVRELYGDRARIDVLRQRGKERVAKYDWDVVARELDRALDRASNHSR